MDPPSTTPRALTTTHEDNVTIWHDLIDMVDMSDTYLLRPTSCEAWYIPERFSKVPTGKGQLAMNQMLVIALVYGRPMGCRMSQRL